MMRVLGTRMGARLATGAPLVPSSPFPRSPLMRAPFSASALLKPINEVATRFPIMFGSTITMVKTVAADLLVQLYVEKSAIDEVDPRRVSAFAQVWNSASLAPALTYDWTTDPRPWSYRPA